MNLGMMAVCFILGASLGHMIWYRLWGMRWKDLFMSVIRLGWWLVLQIIGNKSLMVLRLFFFLVQRESFRRLWDVKIAWEDGVEVDWENAVNIVWRVNLLVLLIWLVRLLFNSHVSSESFFS